MKNGMRQTILQFFLRISYLYLLMKIGSGYLETDNFKSKKILKATMIFFSKSYKRPNLEISFGLKFHKIKSSDEKSFKNNHQIVLHFCHFLNKKVPKQQFRQIFLTKGGYLREKVQCKKIKRIPWGQTITKTYKISKISINLNCHLIPL